jgi:hypothetical protein
MQCSVVLQKFAEISEDHAASILRIEEYAKQVAIRLLLLPGYFLYFISNTKMERVCSFRMSVNFYRTTRRYIVDGSYVRNHYCENLEFKY